MLWKLRLLSYLDYVIAGPLVFGLTWFFLRIEHNMPSVENKDSIVRIQCIIEPCWLRKQGTSILLPLKAKQNYFANELDEVLTSSPGSQLLVRMGDSQITLKNIAAIKISKGALERFITMGGTNNVASRPNELFLKLSHGDDSKEPPDIELPASDETSSQLESYSDQAIDDHKRDPNVVFVGNLSLEIRSPEPGAQIVAIEFPTTVPLYFRTKKRGRSTEVKERLRLWRIYNIENANTPKHVDDVRFDYSETDEHVEYRSRIVLAQPGHYSLVADIDDAEKKFEFHFFVSAKSRLTNTFKELLERGKKSVEIQE